MQYGGDPRVIPEHRRDIVVGLPGVNNRRLADRPSQFELLVKRDQLLGSRGMS